ncbi:NAD(P)/FAD-dependent oxidoreductase [Desulfonema magnum]|uniref:FAD-binding domain-containing protein n=1 Tax=Desulfonema magnum TaxID=45655 RepID=A0A975BKI4_9BACT|nr:NAD(P)/FAD-dependent oxidoreductase [Desulfonema magnum]QTA86972.1 FAD-binding domain-containing protein [Desulfonema magnum]
MLEHKVIVIGSGPGGSACAKVLKEEAIDVLVVEKAKLPRHKTCSGVLFGQTQVLLKKYFGTLPPKEVCCKPEVIKASDILEWHKDGSFSGYVWELAKDGEEFPRAYQNIWRNKFDHWLLKESGADYRDNCRFRGYTSENNKMKVEVSLPDGGTEELLCSYLVGADGSNSRVRTLLAPEGDEQSKECVAYYGYHRFEDPGDLKDGHWYVFMEPDLGDIIACVHHKDDMLAMSVGGFKGCDLKRYIKNFEQFLAEKFNIVFKDKQREEGCVLKIAPPYFGRDNVLLVGDAAGLMYLNGEGISAAIDSGYRAGRAIAGGIKNGSDPVASYTENVADIVTHMQLCMENLHFVVPK